MSVAIEQDQNAISLFTILDGFWKKQNSSPHFPNNITFSKNLFSYKYDSESSEGAETEFIYFSRIESISGDIYKMRISIHPSFDSNLEPILYIPEFKS